MAKSREDVDVLLAVHGFDVPCAMQFVEDDPCDKRARFICEIRHDGDSEPADCTDAGPTIPVCRYHKDLIRQAYGPEGSFYRMLAGQPSPPCTCGRDLVLESVRKVSS